MGLLNQVIARVGGARRTGGMRGTTTGGSVGSPMGTTGAGRSTRTQDEAIGRGVRSLLTRLRR